MSPKTQEQNEEIRQERKEQILQTGLRLFAENGYEATSISKIAKEAGVSKGLMYNYFASKEALMEEIIFLAIKKMAGVFKAVEEQEDPQETVKTMFYLIRDSLKEELVFWKLYIRFGAQLYEKKELMDRLYHEMQGWIEKTNLLMEKLGFKNPAMETFRLSATIDGMTADYIAMTEHYPLDDMIEYLVETYQDKSKL